MQTVDLKAKLKQARAKAAKPMLWIGIVTIIMLFAGLTSAYIVRQAEGNWLQFNLPLQFYISTAFILLSSATMIWALNSVKQNNLVNLQRGLLLTLLFGVGFAWSQFAAWGDLVDTGIFFTGAKSNAAGSYLYVISGVHLAHLAAGLLALLFSFIQAYRGKYSAKNKLGVELVATYWHFLDILWLYLLLFLLFIR